MSHDGIQYNQQQRVAQQFSKAAVAYHQYDAIQRYFGDALLQRLLQPKGCLMDIGCGPGSMYDLLAPLSEYYVGIDIAEGMLHRAKHDTVGPTNLIQADAESLPFRTGAIDVCFANLSLQWCTDLSQAIAEMRRVLKRDGEAAFNLPLRGSFCELQQSWRQVDGLPHTQQFRSLDDVLIDIEGAGITGYQHSIIEYQQWFPDLKTLLQSIKGVGANYVARTTTPGLMTPRRFARLSEHYEVYRTDKGIPLTWRVGLFHFLRQIN